MKIIIFLFLVITLLMAVGCESETTRPFPNQGDYSSGEQGETATPKETTLEYQLAVINAGRQVAENDPTVSQFRVLLHTLSVKYVENKQQIADMSVTAQNILRDAGIEENLLNIVNGINKVMSSTIENQSFAEHAAAYTTLRKKGFSHNEAIQGIAEMLESLGVD